jgi:hypothetical protein
MASATRSANDAIQEVSAASVLVWNFWVQPGLPRGLGWQLSAGPRSS